MDVERSDFQACVAITILGLRGYAGWFVLASPWKPILIKPAHTSQTFTELRYNPMNMSYNPIRDTEHPLAWDYDAINQVVFVKVHSNSVRSILIYYAAPRIVHLSLDKHEYGGQENVQVRVSVHGEYAVSTTLRWTARFEVRDSAGRVVRVVDQPFKLGGDELAELYCNLILDTGKVCTG